MLLSKRLSCNPHGSGHTEALGKDPKASRRPHYRRLPKTRSASATLTVGSQVPGAPSTNFKAFDDTESVGLLNSVGTVFGEELRQGTTSRP